MGRPEESPAAFTTPYSPVIDDEQTSPRGGGCGCFRRLCFGWEEGGSRSSLLQESGGGVREEAWLVAQFKKLKQLSELVAGPKWKNLIRKMGRLCHRKKHPPFHYSPESYALNFAGDHDREEEEDGNPLHSFSARFGPRVPINHAAAS